MLRSWHGAGQRRNAMQGRPAAHEHGATASLERPLPAADPLITSRRIGNDVVLGVASLLSGSDAKTYR